MYQEVYLIKVDPGVNNNKYYRMIPCGDTFRAEYGRVGAGCQTAVYPISKWNQKYNEKIRKGYQDKTELRIEEKPKAKFQYKEIEDADVAELVEQLMKAASNAVQANYTVSDEAVTPAMISAARQILIRLMLIRDKEDFNKALIELFQVIPRRMAQVHEHLAENTSEFAAIISRETALLDVMEGQVKTRKIMNDVSINEAEKNMTILEAMGLEIQPAAASDITKIKKLLGESSRLFNKAWVVVNKKTQGAFDGFMAEHPIKTKLLWHGSRNENWWSILNSGLVLRPQAVITGKMFGNGIYFAPKAQKSIGYTSLEGSYWARGRADCGYMAVFEVGYGKPRNVKTSNGFHGYDYARLKKDAPDCDCVHAHAGVALRNDEIIIYREDQLTIRYLVRLKR